MQSLSGPNNPDIDRKFLLPINFATLLLALSFQIFQPLISNALLTAPPTIPPTHTHRRTTLGITQNRSAALDTSLTAVPQPPPSKRPQPERTVSALSPHHRRLYTHRAPPNVRVCGHRVTIRPTLANSTRTIYHTRIYTHTHTIALALIRH